MVGARFPPESVGLPRIVASNGERRPQLKKLNRRVLRAKRRGKAALVGVLLVSLVFAAPLIQGLALALDQGRNELKLRGFLGLGILLALNLFSLFLIRRQHKNLDEAQDELEALVEGVSEL